MHTKKKHKNVFNIYAVYDQRSGTEHGNAVFPLVTSPSSQLAISLVGACMRLFCLSTVSSKITVVAFSQNLEY